MRKSMGIGLGMQGSFVGGSLPADTVLDPSALPENDFIFGSKSAQMYEEYNVLKTNRH